VYAEHFHSLNQQNQFLIQGSLMAKTVAIIPIKETSKRVQGKNFRLFLGQPLYKHFFSKLVDAPFDEIYVDTDSEEIKAYAKSLGWGVIDRAPELAADTANGNHLLVHQAGIVDADIYFQLFITAPLLSKETIRKSYDIMLNKPEYDSLFTAVEVYSWFWFNGKAVNYDPKELPRSQDAKPIIRETTALYGIRKETLLKHQCRIGEKPYMLFVDEIEAADLDTELDYKMAEFLCKES